MRPGRYPSARARGLAQGYRSGLEEENARHLEAHGEAVLFEVFKAPYVIPAAVHHYTVDFRLTNGILVETKGLWDAKDRAKHLFVRTQYPGLDIRLVFSNPKTKIAPGSPTTVSEWAEKHGFQWAVKLIPLAWIEETGPAVGPEDVLKAGPVGFQDIYRVQRSRRA